MIVALEGKWRYEGSDREDEKVERGSRKGRRRKGRRGERRWLKLCNVEQSGFGGTKTLLSTFKGVAAGNGRGVGAHSCPAGDGDRPARTRGMGENGCHG